MTDKDAVLKILKSSIRESIDVKPSITFIDTSDQSTSESIFAVLKDEASSISPELKVLTTTASSTGWALPIYPFIDLIKDSISGLNQQQIRNFIRTAGVYYYHREIFFNYFTGVSLLRNEEVITGEIEFELNMFISDTFKLITHLNPGKPILVMISRLENISKSGMDFIISISNVINAQRLQFIFSMDITKIADDDNAEDHSKLFINSVLTSFTVLTPSSHLKNENPKTDNIKTVPFEIGKCISLINFLSLDEAVEYTLTAYNDIMNGVLQVSDEEFLIILKIIIIGYHYRGDTDIAILYSNLFINHAQRSGLKHWISDAFRTAGVIYYSKSDIENSTRMAHQGYLSAKETGNIEEIAKAGFTLFLGTDATTRNTDLSPHANDFDYPNLIELLYEIKFYNYLTYIFSKTIYLLYLSRMNGIESALELCSEGIAISKKHGNKFRLSVAYHAQGLLYQTSGNSEKAIISYKSAKKIKEKYGTTIEKARISNGLGFFYFSQDSFPEALKYYYKALSYLEMTKQYEEICTTLCNIGFTYLFTSCFEQCIHYLEEILRIINFLRIGNLPFHPRFNIYSALAIAYLKLKQQSKALDLMNKTNRLPGLRNPFHRVEFEKILLAELNRFNGNISEASVYYEESIAYLKIIETEVKHIILFCYYEYGMMLIENGFAEKASEVLKRGLQEITKGGSYKYHSLIFNSLIKSGKPPAFLKFPFKRFNSSTILEYVKQDTTLNNLHKKIQEINFLNTLQNIILTKQGITEMVKDIGLLIQNSFLTGLCLIAIAREGQAPRIKPAIEYFDTEYSSLEMTAEQKLFLYENILSAFGVEEKIVTKNPSVFEDSPLGTIYSIVYLPLRAESQITGYIVCVIQQKEFLLTKDDIHTLSIAAKQITVAVELKIATQKLIQSATIDGLTGVYNRQELHQRIENELERMVRYKKDTRTTFSILFIDLDNFKFYNDTYGHQIGDFVLKFFVKILKLSTRNLDVIGRFGGDEFVVMLPETSSIEASQIAERIISSLHDQSLLTRFIQNRAKFDITSTKTIPLGCSIGISEYKHDSEMTVNEILHNADVALYDAKSRGKNCFVSAG